VRQPVLAIHAENDGHRAAGEPDALRGASHLRRSVVLAASYHVVSVDLERERVGAEITSFIGELAEARPAPSRA
jgi:hypothetical protein